MGTGLVSFPAGGPVLLLNILWNDKQEKKYTKYIQ